MDKIAKHIRVYVTENCNARCPNCFNSSLRSRAEMSIEKFSEICSFLKSNGVDHIKIMGGEPTIHPHFSQIIRVAQSNFPEVSIFTNAISNQLLTIEPRDKDSIIYNFKFSKAITAEKLLLNYPGERALEVQVLKNSDIQKIKEEILRVYELNPAIRVYLTLDCTADIFAERDIVLEKYEDLQEFCKSNNIHQGQDHILPLCYVRGTKIPIPRFGSKCSLYCAGLIDANYNLRYCNQHPQVIANIYNTEDGLVEWSDLVASLEKKFIDTQEKNRMKKCKDCIFWDNYCNGGCFIK